MTDSNKRSAVFLNVVLAACFLSGGLFEAGRDTTYLYSALVLGCVCLSVAALRVELRARVPLILLAIVTSVLVVTIGVANGTLPSRSVPIFIIGGVGVAMAVAGGAIRPLTALVPMLFWSVYAGQHWISGDSPATLFTSDVEKWASENQVSTFFICAYATLRFSIRPTPRPLMISALAATCIFCMWGRGRAGMAAALLLALGGLYELFITQRRKVVLEVVAALVATALMGWFVLRSFEQSAVWVDPFVEKGVSSEARRLLYVEYSELVDIRSFFLGTDISQSMFIVSMGANLHNSFLMLHCRTGFIGVCLIAVMLLGFWRLVKESRGLAVVAGALIFRAAFDWFMFFTMNDYLFWVLVLWGLGPRLVPSVVERPKDTSAPGVAAKPVAV